jgi:predicted outer membrane protein
VVAAVFSLPIAVSQREQFQKPLKLASCSARAFDKIYFRAQQEARRQKLFFARSSGKVDVFRSS